MSSMATETGCRIVFWRDGNDFFLRFEMVDEGDEREAEVKLTMHERVELVGMLMRDPDPDDELARLRRWKEEALPIIDGLQELGRALGMPLGSRITGPEALDRLAALLAETRADQDARWRAQWEGKWTATSPDDYECCASGRCEVCRG